MPEELKIRVLKFGGTSVRTPEARQRAALRVISARERGVAPIVVVSAIGRKGEPYATDTLIEMVRQIDPAVPPDEREMDLLMACGEIMSSVVFAHILKTLGHAAMAMRGGQAGIRTDGVYGNARISEVSPIGLVEVLRRGAIPVVCGFQGVWVRGGLPGAELTTLGRGGSDTTAAALAAAVGAEALEIYTDVDGIKTAHPSIVPNAQTLRDATYGEIAEMSHLGAGVLHPRAAEIAMKYEVPVIVRNTFSEDEGTRLTASDSFADRRATGIAHTGKLVHFQVDLSPAAAEARPHLRGSLLGLLSDHQVSLFMAGISDGEFSFAVPRSQAERVRALMDGLVAPQSGATHVVQIGRNPGPIASSQAKLLAPDTEPISLPVTMTEGCTMISFVGRAYMDQPGVYADALEALAREQVPVLQTSDSVASLSVLVPESELESAVRALHKRFGLEQIS